MPEQAQPAQPDQPARPAQPAQPARPDQPARPAGPDRHDGGSLRSIAVGVDGSDDSVAALHWACGLAAGIDASVEAVTTWRWPVGLGPPLPVPVEYDPAGDAQTMLDDIVRAETDRHPTVTVQTRVVEGHAAEALVEASRHVDLLVVGSRGSGGFSGLVMGSVSQKVLAHASCPVAVLHSGISAETAAGMS